MSAATRDRSKKWVRSPVGSVGKPRENGNVNITVDVAPSLKERLIRLANHPTRQRKLKVEVKMALERYLAEEEAKEGIVGEAAA